jgi:hypothetical protein
MDAVDIDASLVLTLEPEVGARITLTHDDDE